MQQEPIRIAQIMGKMNRGGVESVVMNYYRAIDKSRIQFDFFVDEDSVKKQVQASISFRPIHGCGHGKKDCMSCCAIITML